MLFLIFLLSLVICKFSDRSNNSTKIIRGISILNTKYHEFGVYTTFLLRFFGGLIFYASASNGEND